MANDQFEYQCGLYKSERSLTHTRTVFADGRFPHVVYVLAVMIVVFEPVLTVQV